MNEDKTTVKKEKNGNKNFKRKSRRQLSVKGRSVNTVHHTSWWLQSETKIEF